MTPASILEEVKTRFMVLYHHDEENLKTLLYRALGKFQEKAGVILEVWSDEPKFELPFRFHAVAGCSDSKNVMLLTGLKLMRKAIKSCAFYPNQNMCLLIVYLIFVLYAIGIWKKNFLEIAICL